MSTVQIQPLTYETFQKYGDFVQIDKVSPEKYQRIGQPPIEFYPDEIISITTNIAGTVNITLLGYEL